MFTKYYRSKKFFYEKNFSMAVISVTDSLGKSAIVLMGFVHSDLLQSIGKNSVKILFL